MKQKRALERKQKAEEEEKQRAEKEKKKLEEQEKKDKEEQERKVQESEERVPYFEICCFCNHFNLLESSKRKDQRAQISKSETKSVR